MKKTLASIAAALSIAASGVLTAPLAHAEVDGYFSRAGDECFEGETYPIYRESPSTLCQFWVPARFLQNDDNVFQVTIKSVCYPQSGHTLYNHYLYRPKDLSQWNAALYELPRQDEDEMVGSVWSPYSLDRQTVLSQGSTYTYQFKLVALTSSDVDQWWPRYVEIYLHGLVNNTVAHFPKYCIDRVEVFNKSFRPNKVLGGHQ